MDMSQKMGCRGEKGDGGISQGISGISPRGGLVNCSVGMEGRSEEGGGGGAGEMARWTACGCTSSGDRSESLRRNREETSERRAKAGTQITAELRT